MELLKKELFKEPKKRKKRMKTRWLKLNPRAKGTNPRAKGTNPRAMKSKAITIGKSENKCSHCKGDMIVRKHPRITEKLKSQYYYFSQWDYCHRCNKVYFNEEFKINNSKGRILEELQDQEKHLMEI